MKKKIPHTTIQRLCIYKRMLSRLLEQGERNISSRMLGSFTGIPDYQVRKDISFIGEIGTARHGYDIKKLTNHIISSLGLSDMWSTAVIGVGQLGTAILGYPRFEEKGYTIKCAFESDPAKIGKNLYGIPIFNSKDIIRTVQEKSIRIGILCIPSHAAQKVCDALILGGIRAVLNFAPVALKIPPSIVKREIDFTVELEFLSSLLNLMKKKKD